MTSRLCSKAAMLLAASMLMVTLNSSALATSAQHCEFPGDVNSDSALNILDVLVVVNAIVGDAACSACCNVNADDEVNLLDVLTMVAAIVNPNTCHCSHGQPAEALLCPDDNAHACASCDEGYALSTTDTPICMLTATLLFKSGFEGGTELSALYDWLWSAPESTIRPDWVSPSTEMTMAHVVPGRIAQGCTPEQAPDCAEDEGSGGSLDLTRGFYVAQTEVTQAQWRTVTGTDPSQFSTCGDECPVESVSWHDAIAFANALSALDGLQPAYVIDNETITWQVNANGYRLPTEAEWEAAARAYQDTRFAGSQNADAVAWYGLQDGSGPRPVSTLLPNAHGLYDMSGNVAEWVWDWYAADYYSTSPTRDATGPATGSERGVRGGHWSAADVDTRVASRGSAIPSSQDATIGVRLVRTATMTAAPTGALVGVSAGATHSCAVSEVGEVRCWGSNQFAGVSDDGVGGGVWNAMPALPGQSYVAVSAGTDSSCAIRDDSRVECWGGVHGQANPGEGYGVPSVETFSSVSVGLRHSCGLLTSGYVTCWGSNDVKQYTDIPTEQIFKQLSVGTYHACGLTDADTVACWGLDRGEVPTGTFTQVSAGHWHSCGIRSEGQVVCWGTPRYGEISAVPTGSFSQVSAGGAHTCAISSLDGAVQCWGRDNAGQVSGTPAGGGFTDIDAGDEHTCGVRNGAIECWGNDLLGQSSPFQVTGDWRRLRNSGYDQHFSGHDETTGFSWPPSFPGLAWWRESFDLHGITGYNNPWPDTHYMSNTLEETAGPAGTPTRALTMAIYNDALGTKVAQNNIEFLFDVQETGLEPAPLYMRFWMRPSPEIYQAFSTFGSGWHLIWESKTLAHCPEDQDNDYCPSASFRFQLFVKWINGELHYSYNSDSCTVNSTCVPLATADQDVTSCEEAGLINYCSDDEQCQSTGYKCGNPKHWEVPVPMTQASLDKWISGAWMPVEIFLYRNPDDHTDGRFYAAVDEVTIVDESPAGADGIIGTTDDRAFWEGDIWVDPSLNNHPTGFWLMPLYGLRYMNHSVSYDDFEFWDAIPCAAPPCGGPAHTK